MQPSSPSAVITVDADVPTNGLTNDGIVLQGIPFLAGNVDADSITNLHPAVVLYPRTDGSL